MQKPGEPCKECADFWKARGKQPMTLRRLAGTTINKNIVVAACAHCDGEPIFSYRQQDFGDGS